MIRLRPHHILDIIRNIGNDRKIAPHEYGHLVHIITQSIINDINQECILVNRNDDICGPCIMLNDDKKCLDVLRQLNEPISKQIYNDDLDNRIFHYLGIKPDTIITIKAYLYLVKNDLDGIIKICTHPKEDIEYRRNGLVLGMKKLGV
jgi:hypothetical protein